LWAIVATVLAFVPLAFALAVPGYQRERLAVFLDPDRDPLGSGFTLRQVEIALGGGGVTGRGFELAGSALDGLSTRNSDFALAQIGEQLGLLGTLTVLIAFAVVAWRGLAIAESAPDRFGQLLGVGLTSLIVVQALLHVAVNVRLFPATGIPLPLISLGGSSMIAACAMIGLLLSIASRRQAGPLERWSGARWD
jgi:cell division protein FtsW